MSERDTGGSERPEGWPEQFSAAGEVEHCPHQFVWDTGHPGYVCIYCQEQRDEPPERYLDKRGGR